MPETLRFKLQEGELLSEMFGMLCLSSLKNPWGNQANIFVCFVVFSIMAGRRAGLLSVSDLKRESERKREREAEMFAKMDPSISGKGSETVYRDKMGRKKDIKMDRIKRREEERKEMEDNEKFMKWGRG